MHSYTIYSGISHVNQLTKLRPTHIGKIRSELDDIARRFGGRRVDADLYVFPPSLGETSRKTAEAAAAMYAFLRDNDRELYGVTVLVAESSGESAEALAGALEPLLLRVPEENGFWVAPGILDDVSEYLNVAEEEGLFRVTGLKEAGLRLEERLPRLLVRPERLKVLVQALELLERDDNECNVLLIRGRIGAGKRATLAAALKKLYPDDGGSPLIIPFASDAEDPMEPFSRAPGAFMAAVSEYLDEEERRWWEEEGYDFLEQSRKGRIREASRDQGPVDLIQAFALYVKAHLERRRRSGRPAYVVVDGFEPDSEAVVWLRSLLTEFLSREAFRLVILRDSDDFDEEVPLPGKGREVAFRRPVESEWAALLEDASAGDAPTGDEAAALADSCGSSLYRLFHSLLARERGLDVTVDPGEALVTSLDRDTRSLLFLVHAASGLATRRLLVERAGSDDESLAAEGARYDGLMDFGLIREDPDGRCRLIPGGPSAALSRDLDRLREAERFGEYLCRRLEEGDSIDLFRLFRYLEAWGPVPRAIAILDRLLEGFLADRRLRAVGLLLNGPPMSPAELDGPDMEALQNVLGAARLRYVLLSGDAGKARSTVRDGTVTLIAARGGYADRFRLQQARFSYAMGRWDDALDASKEALFNFQKSGDHEGETHSHLELALSLMALGKVRDALEHFGIARRIGSQVSASWGVMRAASMEAVGQFLFGNLPRAARDCRESRATTHHGGRRDLWLLLTLAQVRIGWELGRYGEAASSAEEGRRLARFYGLNDEAGVLLLWKGRCLAAQGLEEGWTILREAGASREALAFLAEAEWLADRPEEARAAIHRAAELPRRSLRLQGEAEDWSDGFFPIEGRLADSSGPLDVLGEWIRAFGAFLDASGADPAARERLESVLAGRNGRVSRPFSYHYALWAAMVTPDEDRQTRTRFMSRAFNDLQARAGRFDDNQTKHAWLTANPWNRLLMEEAQRLKFL